MQVCYRTRSRGLALVLPLLCSMPAMAGSYQTDFPATENPISEGGRWINGGLLGLDWTNVSTTPGLAIGHQVGANFTDATALLAGAWGPDQMATATVYT